MLSSWKISDHASVLRTTSGEAVSELLFELLFLTFPFPGVQLTPQIVTRSQPKRHGNLLAPGPTWGRT